MPTPLSHSAFSQRLGLSGSYLNPMQAFLTLFVLLALLILAPASFAQTTTVNDTDSGITYTGTGWVHSASRGFGDIADDVHATQSNGDAASYTFTGGGIRYLGETDSGEGNVQVYLDGTLQATVNCYSVNRQSQHIQWSLGGLAAGSHTVKLVKLDGTYMQLDAFQVTPLPGSAVTLNDTDTGIVYTGGWFHSASRGLGDYQDDVHATATNGDSASYTFNGNGISYVGETDSGEGNVQVYLDGALQATVNCYSAVRQSQHVQWSITGLGGGSHVLKLVKQDGAYMQLDALIVVTLLGATINDTDSGIAYTGGWFYSPSRGFGDYQDDIHATAANGDFLTYTFTGSGISYLGESDSGEGNVQVYLDSVLQATVNCYSASRLSQHVQWASGSLAGGSHVLKLVKQDGAYMQLDALQVTSTPPLPAYLSNLTLPSTTIIGGSGATGTVTLSSLAPAGGITIALHSNNSAVVVPATRTISAGSTQTTFSVTTTAVSSSATATLSGSYNGWTQGFELSVLPSTPPSAPSVGTPLVHVAPGNGCAVVSWNRLPDGTVSGYNVYRTSGGTTTLLTSTPFKSNFYPDIGLTNDTATYTYQVAGVDLQGQEHTLSVPVSTTPSSAAVTLNWISTPSAVTDTLTMSLELSAGGATYGSSYLIDGVQAGFGGSQSRPINGVQTYTTGATFDSSELSNGPHVVQFLGFTDSNETVAAVTPTTLIQVSNAVSSFRVDNSWFAPTQGELCYVSATAPAGSTWIVQVTSQDGATVFRTWQGASSLVNLAWDGKDASGSSVPIADYTIQVTVQPPGASSNAAGAVKKTRPVKMLQGQPVALALVSVGASYYNDSNGNPVATPAQDITLSDTTLKNAYTKLFGSGNFQIIRSDTFKPFVEVKKGVTGLQQLEGWLGTAQVFYLFGHGAGTLGEPGPSRTPRSTVFGAYDQQQGSHLELFPATVLFSLSDEDVVVPTYVKSHNYVFAWNDSCNSAGGNSVTGERGTPDYVWATAFNATTFIGNNGYDIVNNSGATNISNWYKWRNTFWNNLSLGQNITQAYLDCWVVDGRGPGGTHLPYGDVDTGTYYDRYALGQTPYDCTPGDGYGSSNPRVAFYGEPDTTTLVP